MADLDWRDRAACVNKDPELWFPVNGLAGASEAIKICVSKCAVRVECGKNAVAMGLRDGVHAGFFLPDQRSPLRRFAKPDGAALMLRSCEGCGVEMQTRVAVRLCGKCRKSPPARGRMTEEVREHLISIGASSYRLAEASGVGRTTIRDIMTGKRKSAAAATIDTLLALTPEAVQ